MTAVRDLLAATPVDGSPIDACKRAVLEAIDVAYAKFASEPAPYRPQKRGPLAKLTYGLRPRDLGAARATTLRARMIAILDRAIALQEDVVDTAARGEAWR